MLERACSGGLVDRDRREFLVSLLGSSTLLIGFDKVNALGSYLTGESDPFEGGQRFGILEFAGEGRTPLGTMIGTGLDARLYSDLSTLSPEELVTPVEKFYVRTAASELLDDSKAWKIKVSGLVERPANIAIDELKEGARPMGMHLMECSGNARATRFSLLSVADWTGVAITDLLDRPIKPGANRVMVSGFDQYPTQSAISIPGAEWTFTLEQLRSAKAFLATEMNGKPLTKDHGAPVRLVVPGWYGCTCIKWVNAITFVGDDVEATSQMQEFAARTHQQGVHKLVKNYTPATIDQAAMPIRVEKWVVNGKLKYRVVGILWGGSRPVKALEIRFNPDGDYVRVDKFSQRTNDPWSFWSHAWEPKPPGTYFIRLRVSDPVVETKRLDSGHYVRSVEVTEV